MNNIHENIMIAGNLTGIVFNKSWTTVMNIVGRNVNINVWDNVERTVRNNMWKNSWRNYKTFKHNHLQQYKDNL